MRRSLILIALLAVLVGAYQAEAGIPILTPASTIRFLAPTESTDGTPLTDLASYRLTFTRIAPPLTGDPRDVDTFLRMVPAPQRAPATGTILSVGLTDAAWDEPLRLGGGLWQLQVVAIDTDGLISAPNAPVRFYYLNAPPNSPGPVTFTGAIGVK